MIGPQGRWKSLGGSLSTYLRFWILDVVCFLISICISKPIVHGGVSYHLQRYGDLEVGYPAKGPIHQVAREDPRDHSATHKTGIPLIFTQ